MQLFCKKIKSNPITEIIPPWELFGALLSTIGHIYFVHVKYIVGYMRHGYREFDSWIFLSLLLLPMIFVCLGVIVGEMVGRALSGYDYIRSLWVSLVFTILLFSFLGAVF